MGVEELIENLVWSATFLRRAQLRVVHQAHQAARRKLAFRYGKAFTEMERMAPLYAIGRDIARGLIKGCEVRAFSLFNESFGTAPRL